VYFRSLFRFIFYCLTLLISSALAAQKPYFQQVANISMSVTLDDQANTLRGFQKLEYQNNSPDSLDFIFIHLWPNAYKDNSTALAGQLLRLGKRDFNYASDEERGYIDSLAFSREGKLLRFNYLEENQDICRLELDNKLPPGSSMTITTPFFVKIPSAKFSRFGRIGQAYYVTQWYPKPAVYDNRGWHPMPYLDQGEYYSEFGKFDVSIELPANYIIAATGNRAADSFDDSLMAARESETLKRENLGDYREFDMGFPPSSVKMKTVRFTQENVHDFAWFADKRFNVIGGSVKLRSGKAVKTWTYFTNRNFAVWKKGVRNLNDALAYYSEFVGEYPYDQASAVDGTIMAGSGMEYPDITVIGSMSSPYQLEMTIVHEAGHNWFYGMLASNEREHAWMDEGLNSYYEAAYSKFKYPGLKLTDFFGRDSTFRFLKLNHFPLYKEHELLYMMSARRNTDQALDLNADDYSEFNYGAQVYAKPALFMNYLRDFLGEEKFDAAMHDYFEKFRFKHPYPEDFFATLSESTGIDLTFLQRHFIESTRKIDFGISGIKKISEGLYRFRIRNYTGAQLPFNVSATRNNSILATAWVDSLRGSSTFTIRADDPDHLVVDARDDMPDVFRRNNSMRVKGIFRKGRKPQLSFISSMENPRRAQINYLPLVGANSYNGLMAGLALHNFGFYRRKYEYHLAPMYAFQSWSLAGLAGFERHWLPRNYFSCISAGVNVKTFAYDQFRNITYNGPTNTYHASRYLDYWKVNPFVTFEFKERNPRMKMSSVLTVSSAQLFTDSVVYSHNRLMVRNVRSYINQVNFDHANNGRLDPYDLNINLQQIGEISRISATVHYDFSVSRKNAFLFRGFAGAFLSGRESSRSYYAFRASGQNGYQDYAFNGYFAGRNERKGTAFSQFLDNDGGLKVWTPLGYSTSWMAGINVKSPRLPWIPLRLFADGVITEERFTGENEGALWDAGINFTFFRDIVEVYFPVLYNAQIAEVLELNGIKPISRLRFTFNIHKLSPANFIQDLFR
jgi:hypothetical protein